MPLLRAVLWSRRGSGAQDFQHVAVSTLTLVSESGITQCSFTALSYLASHNAMKTKQETHYCLHNRIRGVPVILAILLMFLYSLVKKAEASPIPNGTFITLSGITTSGGDWAGLDYNGNITAGDWNGDGYVPATSVSGLDASFPTFSYHTLATLYYDEYPALLNPPAMNVSMTTLVVVQASGYSDTLGTNYIFLQGSVVATNIYFLGGGEIVIFTGSYLSNSATTIWGHVTSTTAGTPIGSASVQIGVFSTTSDASGNYSILSIAPGTYTAKVAASGYSVVTNTVIIPKSVQSMEENFSLSQAPATVTGNVSCTCGGSVIAGASVQIGSYSGTSGSGGSYSISNIPPGTYTVIVSANNYKSITNTATIGSGAATYNFSLSPAQNLDYFGIGVNWTSVGNPPYLRGDVGASDLLGALFSQLPSIFNLNTSTVVALNATDTSINNANNVISQFNTFANKVCANDTVVLYVATHGGNVQINGTPTSYLALGSDVGNYPTFVIFITDLLKRLPPCRKVVILETCYSMGLAYQLADQYGADVAVLASSTSLNQIVKDGIYYGSENQFYTDGVGVFTHAIISMLDNNIFDLNTLSADITANLNNLYAYALGQNLSFEDSGSAIFTGLQAQLYKSSDFKGNLTNNVASNVQPPPSVIRPAIRNGSFQMTITNVPASGSIAVEQSMDLISWLQVSFSPATGTNQIFSYSLTNGTCSYFRTLLVR